MSLICILHNRIKTIQSCILGGSLGWKINVGSKFYSDSKHCYIELQTDGNLVLYREFDHKAFWDSGTGGKDIPNLQFQSDGNLVLYEKGGSAVWASDTDDEGAKRMVMQNDGNFVIYDGDDKSVWSTRTSGKGACSGALPIFFSCLVSIKLFWYF